MKRKWLIAGALATGVAALGGLAYAASDQAGPQHGAGFMRGEGTHGMGPGGMGGMQGMGAGMHGQMGPGMRGQTGHGMMQGGMHGGPGRMSAADPAQIDGLKTQLAITPAQETAWTKYATAVKDAASSAKAAREGIDRDAVHKMSPQDRQAFMTGMREQRQKEFATVKAAADELLRTLDDTQKTRAQDILPGLAFGPGMRGAGMGGARHRH